MGMKSHDFPEGYFGEKQGEFSEERLKLSIRNLQNYKRKHILSFIKSLPQDAMVLDSGCGKGKTIGLIKFLRPDITIKGHDVTDMSAFLPKDVDFKKCTTEELDTFYETGVFDAIICQHVFEHLVYPTIAMENFIKLLKPGGRVLIETPNWTRLFIPFSRLYFWNDYTHIHPFSKRAFERIFSEYGMQIEKIVTASSVDYRTLVRTAMGFSLPKEPINKSAEKKFKTKIPKSKFRKLFDWAVEFFINPFTKDILIGVASKPKV